MEGYDGRDPDDLNGSLIRTDGVDGPYRELY
jgi:hypothetical protein